MAKNISLILVCLFIIGATDFFIPNHAHAAPCDAIVGKWAWFIGGEVTVNPDRTFVQQSGNAGTWECTDAARGKFTFRWRDGGFVNSLAMSPDGQGLSSTDLSQSYVTAQRSGPATKPGQLVREDDCCQEEYDCEIKKIEAEFDQKLAQCHYPGNATCNAEAVNTKASGLKAAGEKLRLCNRATNNKGPFSGVGAGGGLPTPPASNDEFHSTDGVGFFSQKCQACEDVQDTGQMTGGGGDSFGSDPSSSDNGKPAPTACTPEFYDRDVPAASDEWRYVLGFEQEVRRCLKAQLTAQNLAVYALAAKVKEIAAILAIAAAPGAIDAVLHPPGSSANPDAYLKGKEEAARLCEWALKVSPAVMARCPAKSALRSAPAPRLPPRQTLAQLLSDLTWLKEINPAGRKSCGNDVLATEQALAGRGVLPSPPMPKGCGTFPDQLESLLGAEFGPIREAAEINNAIFHAGEGARGIVSADGPGGGHYFNIVRFSGDVLLLDAQLGRQVSWAEYRRMGLNNFQLLRTN